MGKVLVFATEFDVGGVTRALISLLDLLHTTGCEIDLVMVNPSGLLKQYVPEGINIIPFPQKSRWIFIPRQELIRSFINSFGNNLNFFKFGFFLVKGILCHNMNKARQQLLLSCMHTLPKFEGQYDVAVDFPGLYKSLIVSKVDAKAKLSWVHGDYKLLGRDKRIDNIDYYHIDAVITVTESCQKMFIAEFPQYKSKCHTMPNISNKANIKKMARKEVYFDDSFSGTRILDVTRLDPEKGLDIALEACQILKQQGKNVRWYILGEGPERKKLEAKIKENDMADSFVLLGSKANPYPYMMRADYIVHCSMYEGRSVAIDEAMLLAKPIILTDYPTAKDQIESGVNGLICDMSPQGVYLAINSLLENESLRNGFIENLQNFNINSNHALAVFKKILGPNESADCLREKDINKKGQNEN